MEILKFIDAFFKYLPYQFKAEKYIEYIEHTDIKKELKNDPLCLYDKNQDGTTYEKTKLSEVIKKHSFHNELIKEFKLNTVATANSDFEKSLQILSWLTKNTHYNGIRFKCVNDNSLELLKFSLGKPFTHALNCRNKAIVFSDCLVALDVKAYPICMLSMHNDCHFSVRVYISELNKWCAFDPSFGCWFSDETGSPLDVFEIRDLFLQGRDIIINDYNFNGTQKAKDVYMSSFLRKCMSNLSTWGNNSTDFRNKVLGKKFCFAIPEEEKFANIMSAIGE